MSFKWEVNKPSAEELPVCEAEEINLNDLTIVVINGWAVNDSDETKNLPAVPGGGVDEVGVTKEKENEETAVAQNSSPFDSEKGFNRRILFLLAVFFGIGFLAVVGGGVFRGTLTFEAFMTTITAFLFGFGIGNFPKSPKLPG